MKRLGAAICVLVALAAASGIPAQIKDYKDPADRFGAAVGAGLIPIALLILAIWLFQSSRKKKDGMLP